jgi:hypothetical protein
MAQMIEAPETQRCRVSSHFLPKFDNQSEGARLTSDPAAAGARCLAVSKKHSGHLVMAPPFYSKNGVANKFSRLGELLLREHFRTVWPDEPSAFERWWKHATRHSLCYSFECVTPRIAGDHGATPLAAYMVLTCVVHAGSDGILSPAQLLQLGASWRLPLNQVWYIAWTQAAAVEERLHGARWTMADAEADAILEGFGAPQQLFLRHGETQGEVLEGFVLMALDQPTDALLPLLTAYEAVVAPHRSAALDSALELGRACRDSEPWLVQALESPVTSAALEPRQSSVAIDRAWKLATTGSSPLAFLFQLLQAAYGHKVKLKPYEYAGRLQLQVEVGDDQVFFGWKLHMALRPIAPLYRGMVVTFDSHTPPPLAEALACAPAAAAGIVTPAAGGLDLTSGNGACLGDDPAIVASQPCCAATGAADGFPALPTGTAPVRVLAIAKLKCLRYLMRTFGVRNLMSVLLDHGPAAYIRRTQKFADTWGVPEDARAVLLATLAQWPHEVALLSPTEREELREGSDGTRGAGGSYLRFLEPFLQGSGRVHRAPADGDASSAAADRLRGYALLLVNLTGGHLSNEQLEPFRMGLLTLEGSGAQKQLQPGTSVVVQAPPTNKHLRKGVPLLVLVFGPPEGAEIKWHKMFGKCSELPSSVPELDGKVFLNLTPEQWEAAVSALPKSPMADAMADSAAYGALSGGDGGKGAADPYGGRALLDRTVVAVAALPPGGGKSSLFQALENLGWGVVSSDFERSRSGNFDHTLARLLRARPLVCYDKNLPDAAALAKLCRVLRATEGQHGLRVRVLLVVPDRLEHDIAWQRIRDRPSTDIALSCHIDGGPDKAYSMFHNIFFLASQKLLPLAQSLPGAEVSSAFWESLEASEQLADVLHRRAEDGEAPSIESIVEALESSAEGRAAATTSYMAATIPGTKLHMTLVPPAQPGASSATNAERGRAILALQPFVGATVTITLRAYHLANWRAGGGGARARRSQQLAVWEVEAVSGLPDELHFPAQSALYHVTDTAALIGRTSRDVFEFVCALKGGTVDRECELRTVTPPEGMQLPPQVLAVVTEI